jgi:hypothetical protein
MTHSGSCMGDTSWCYAFHSAVEIRGWHTKYAQVNESVRIVFGLQTYLGRNHYETLGFITTKQKAVRQSCLISYCPGLTYFPYVIKGMTYMVWNLRFLWSKCVVHSLVGCDAVTPCSVVCGCQLSRAEGENMAIRFSETMVNTHNPSTQLSCLQRLSSIFSWSSISWPYNWRFIGGYLTWCRSFVPINDTSAAI